MKLTDTLSNINLALNYPALTYEDIKLYFDMAISELNTTLHTSIPTVSTMIKEFRQKMSKIKDNQIVLDVDPYQNDFSIDVNPDTPADGNPKCYYNSKEKCYYAWNKFTKEYSTYPSLVGIYIRDGVPEKYISAIYGTDVYWIKQEDNPDDCDFIDYLPDDWILLWLIPYVCFKYTVRDGGTAQTFAEEMQQGFQQLQETYDVPSKVLLATYADKPAYTELVAKHLPNLNVKVYTRAIYDSMKHGRSVNAVYGNMFDRGGFGDD